MFQISSWTSGAEFRTSEDHLIAQDIAVVQIQPAELRVFELLGINDDEEAEGGPDGGVSISPIWNPFK